MRAYETEWAGFLDALTSDTEMPATVQDGVNALALAEAANISHREGRTVAITAQMVGAES
jgi:myo-inositol 2-dehydrogenase/D-chiro-inositol 1-dehydrogenase